MILVLLYRFSETLDSILGYKLCEKLVQEGHELLVTTTAKKDELKTEQEAARYMSEKWKGSVTVVGAEYEELDEPSPEWIAKLHKTYFGFLSELKDVDTIIGTLPGTTKTAVDLKNILNCKLVLLVTTKIGVNKDILKAEINQLAPQADEIWSVGSDIYSHYQNIFQEARSIDSSKHKRILVQPAAHGEFETFFWEWNPPDFNRKAEIRKVVSVWNNGYQFFYRGKRTKAKGGNLENFQALSAALGKINETEVRMHKKKIQWHIHGLKSQTDLIKSIREVNTSPVELVPFKNVASLEALTWKNCLAFIIPDIYDENFNIMALTAIWLGIPTLVSSESSIGKFLLGLKCPVNARAVVHLEGNINSDKKIWTDKIYKEILNHDARPMLWAQELSQYIQKNHALWDLDLSILPDTSAQSGGSSIQLESSPTDPVQPHTSSIVAKTNQVSSQEPEERKRLDTDLTFFKSQGTARRWTTPLTYGRGYVDLQKHKPSKENTERTKERIDTAISQRLDMLNKFKSDVENTVSSAIEEMQAQHPNIPSELNSLFHEQVAVIEDAQKHLLQTISQVVAKLQTFDKQSSQLPQVQDKSNNKGAKFDLAKTQMVKSLNQFSQSPDTEDKTEENDTIDNGSSVDSIPLTTVQSSSINTDSLVTDTTENTMTDIISSVQSSISPQRRNGTPRLSLKLKSRIDKKNPSGIHLKTFQDALFMDKSLWICGWNKNRVGKSEIVMLQVQGSDCIVRGKQKDASILRPVVMLPHGQSMLYAKLGSKDIVSFNTQSHSFEPNTTDSDISGFCYGRGHFYILSQRNLKFMRVLDSSFYHKSNIVTGIDSKHQCDVDMCFIPGFNVLHRGVDAVDHVIVIAKSAPSSSVRALNNDGDLLWELNCRNNIVLEERFDACSVAASEAGDIFVADRGTDKIYSISADGDRVQVLLSREEGIQNPTRVQVDGEGKRLVVVNRDGGEVRCYRIKRKETSSDESGDSDYSDFDIDEKRIKPYL